MKNLKQLICEKFGICNLDDVIQEIKGIPKIIWLLIKLLFAGLNVIFIFVFGVIRIIWTVIFGVISAITKALIIDSVISNRKK